MHEDDTFRALKRIPVNEMVEIIAKNNAAWEKINSFNRTLEEIESFHENWTKSNLKKLEENGWTEEEYINL